MNEENINKLKLIIHKQIKICFLMEVIYGKADKKTVLALDTLNNLCNLLSIAEGRCKV